MSHQQRTIAMPFIPLFSAMGLLIFSSCADKVKTDLITYKGLDEGLINSNISISYQVETIISSIEDRMADPRTSGMARVWYEKAKLVYKLSNETCFYIDDLKNELKKGAIGEEGNDIELIREENKIAVRRLFINKGKASWLYDRLEKYKTDLLAIDPSIKSNFASSLPTISGYFESPGKSSDKFFTIFFSDMPAVAVMAMLSKFQNNVKIVESKVIEFCHNQTSGPPSCDFGRYGAVAAISSRIVKARESIEIVAGVGTFRNSFQPTIKIYGKNIPIDVDGLAHYKFVGSDKPGKHLIPVEISYTDLDGNEKMVTKEISYTVATLK